MVLLINALRKEKEIFYQIFVICNEQALVLNVPQSLDLPHISTILLIKTH